MEQDGVKVFIPAKSDIIFKALFGDELNKAFLISFLKAVLKLDIDEYAEIQIVDPQLNPILQTPYPIFLLIAHLYMVAITENLCYNKAMKQDTGQVFIPAKSDVFFKALFGDELNKAFLISFFAGGVKAGH